MDQPRISKGLSLSKARSVGKQIKSSLPWVAVEAVVNVIYGAAMVGVIGWLIPPSEFGAASAALAAIYLVETFSKAGIQDALIRERSIHTEVTDVGHTTSVGLSIIGMIVSIAIAFPLSRVMDDNRIASFILVSSFILPLNALVAAPLGIFMRKMRAAQVMRRQVTSKIVSLIVIVVGGLYGFGAWAIIVSSVTVPAVAVVNIWLLMPRFPKFRWNYRISKRLIFFGFAVSGELACWSLMSRAFALLFGYFHGLHELGALQFAFRLVDEVANLVRLVVSRLGLSAFAALHRVGGDIAVSFEKGTRLINVASAPTFAGLALLAPFMVPILFGHRWNEAIPYIQIFSISWMVAMPRILVSPALRAIGKQYLQLSYAAVSAFVALAATVTIGQISPFLAGVAFASRQLVSVPWGVLTMRRLLGLSTSRQVLALLPALTATALMALVIEAALYIIPNGHLAVKMISTVFIGAITYVVSIVLIDRKSVKMARSILKRN